MASKPLLIETVTGRTMAELRAARDASREADMVELRLDGVADLDVAGALANRSLPAIVTCRPAWEGGRFEGSEEERQRILAEALRLGADYVDLEWRGGFEETIGATSSARIVLSSHDFDGVPADLADRVRAMRATGARIVKVAVAAHRLCDALPLREVTGDGRTVAIAMGPSGMPTRVLAAKFGSCWTYGGNGAAPGQIPIARMVHELRFRQISASTTVYGLVGTSVEASKSPAIQNAMFTSANIDGVYLPLPTTSFDDFLAFADATGVAGAAVTIPFKLDALRNASRADAMASKVGAANTLRRCPDGWEATNTDVAGFLAPLQGRDLRGARVAVLGAGGAARAVVVALVSVGARPTVCARRVEQARDVAALGAEVGEWPPKAGSWDILVNCTPIGGVASPGESPLPGGPFGGRLVYDLLYRPEEPRLLREAKAAGCEVINGYEMLKGQARKQFDWWLHPELACVDASGYVVPDHAGGSLAGGAGLEPPHKRAAE